MNTADINIEESLKRFSELINTCIDSNKYFLLVNKEVESVYRLILKLDMFVFDVFGKCIEKGEDSMTFMLMYVVLSRLNGLELAFLLGDLPTCYMNMRLILEGLVDSVIISTRFRDSQFPENLENLWRLEKKKNIKFSEKVDLLLPRGIRDETKKECKKLWEELCRYWAHSSGIIRKLKEYKKYIPPKWAFAIIPSEYEQNDLEDIKELQIKLEKLFNVTEDLLEVFKSKVLGRS